VNTAQQAPPTITTPVLALNQTYEQTTGMTWDLATSLLGPVQSQCIHSVSPATYGSCAATIDVIYPSSCTAGASPCSASGPVPVVFSPNGTPSARVIAGATGPGAGNQASTTGFPFLTNYGAWAGTCADAQPGAAFVEGLTSVPGQAALIWPGNATITLFGQTVTVPSYGGAVTVSHASDANCTSGETYTYLIPSSLPVGDTALALAVPVGANWTFKDNARPQVANVAIPPTALAGLPL
jgi:hypothetical protein